jgi:hypothetical protein
MRLHTACALYIQALETWLTRVTACVKAEQQQQQQQQQDQQQHSMPQWCSSCALDSLLQQTSTLVMCTWESPFKAVAAIVPRVFQQLVTLQQVRLLFYILGVHICMYVLITDIPFSACNKHCTRYILLLHVSCVALLHLQQLRQRQ